jgi:hypothetical protein
MEGLNLEQDPTQCHAELRHAIRLYAMGEALLAYKGEHLISTRLVLAVVNNTGHAYQVLNETESASVYWQALMSLLMLCFNRGGKEAIGLHCFLENAVYMTSGRKITCATAA